MRYLFFTFFILFSSLCFAQKTSIATVSVQDSLTIMKANLTPEQLKLKKSKFENIQLTVYYNKSGKLDETFKNLTPANNEIVFGYALNYEEGIAEMKFKLGKDMKKALSKKDFDQMIALVKILEHDIFDIKSFSGTKAYAALEEALTQ